MNKFLIIFIFFVMPCFGQDTKSESIPNSKLTVSFPSDWNFSKPYIGEGKYSSIKVYLPKEEHGGYPGHPEFEFEFLESRSKDKRLKHILKNKHATKKIGGIKSKSFKYKSEVSYLLSDMSHSSATLEVYGYLVPISKGYLICALTTQSSEEIEYIKYINVLETYCKSAVESAKQPNKA